MREIEIKLRVDNLDELENKLTESGLVISKEITQHDVIYAPGDNMDIFSEVKEGNIVIRIRDENGVSKLTLKQQRRHGLDKTEFETKVEDREMIHQMLLVLGWKPAVEVKKKRKKGKLGEYEVCLDNVDGLGTFIELEKMVADDTADPEKIKGELFEALKPFGLSEKDEETKGYDILMYQLKNK